MDKNINGETLAAITMALFEFTGHTSHVEESGVIRMEQNESQWNSPLRNMRVLPNKK